MRKRASELKESVCLSESVCFLSVCLSETVCFLGVFFSVSFFFFGLLWVSVCRLVLFFAFACACWLKFVTLARRGAVTGCCEVRF